MFGLAVLAGMSLVFIGVRYHRSSLTLSMGHAAIAVTAVVLLVIHIIRAATNHLLYNDAVFLFILTLGGGIVLLMLRGDNKPAPIPIVIVHAFLALLALALLVKGYIQS